MILAAILFIGAFGLNGCMVMHMAHGKHGSHSSAERLVKEREIDDIVIRLEVPPLYVGQEATLRVKVADTWQSEPVKADRVLIRIRPQGMANDQEVVEKVRLDGAKKGHYEVKHTFAKAGSYDISATATIQTGAPRELSVTVTQDVADRQDKTSKKMTKPLLILGGIGMGVMMVFMFL